MLQEALSIVLDVGSNMDQAAAGAASFLDTSLTAVRAILQRKLFAESKDEIALILCGTSDTANDLSDGSSYAHVSLARPLGVVNWDLVKFVENDVSASDVTGDFIDALVVAMDALVKGVEGKRGFVSKRLILFTDAGAPFGDDSLDDIVSSMKEAAIELNVIGPDLDDEEEEDEKKPLDTKPGASNGHEKEKSTQQRAGEAMLRHILAQVDGVSYSFAEALPALAYFQSRQVRPTAWKADLEVGSQLKIPLEGFIRMKEAKMKSFKNVYAKDAEAAIERARTYHLNDEDRTEVTKAEVVDGHRYGSTLVPFSEDDKEAFKFETEKGLKVLGFTKLENVKRHHFLGDSTMTFIAAKDDEAAAVALSALASALYETNCCAIVRRVYAKNGKVCLGCLIPHIKADYECLFYNELPYCEDVRQFTFSSLPVKEATDANRKFEPSEAQLDLVYSLISNMDLVAADRDEDGDVREALKPKLTFNPHLQRLYQCLQQRAMRPGEPLPDLAPLVAESLRPPQEVQSRCSQIVDKLRDAFKLTERAPSAQGAAAMFKDDDAAGEPASKRARTDADGAGADRTLQGGLAEIVKAKVTEVGTVTPVEDFRALLADKEQDRFDQACRQMQERVTQIVVDSFGTQSYSKALECVKALREEAVKNSEPNQFNEFVRSLKPTLHGKGREDFWQQMVKARVSLIHSGECSCDVTAEQSAAFLAEGADSKPEKVEAKRAAEDVGDLMDDF